MPLQWLWGEWIKAPVGQIVSPWGWNNAADQLGWGVSRQFLFTWFIEKLWPDFLIYQKNSSLIFSKKFYFEKWFWLGIPYQLLKVSMLSGEPEFIKKTLAWSEFIKKTLVWFIKKLHLEKWFWLGIPYQLFRLSNQENYISSHKAIWPDLQLVGGSLHSWHWTTWVCNPDLEQGCDEPSYGIGLRNPDFEQSCDTPIDGYGQI